MAGLHHRSYVRMTVFAASFTSEPITVCLPAWFASSTACFATCAAMSSIERRSSSTASLLTLSAPDFLIMRYTAASPNSASDKKLQNEKQGGECILTLSEHIYKTEIILHMNSVASSNSERLNEI